MKMEVSVSLTPAQVAVAFCDLNDDQQAAFFEEVGQIAATWGPCAATMQWHYVGRHMRNCACATAIGRSVIEEIGSAMKETE